jgi:hypothetical protein
MPEVNSAGALSQVLLEFFPVVPTRLAGPLLPRENADSSNAIEADPPQRGEKAIPVDLALADVQMLMYSRWRPWGVHDVAQARGRGVIEGVSKVYVGQQVTGVLHDFGHVAAHMECVRCAVQERNVRGVNPANYVDRGLAVLDEVVRVRLQPQLHPFPFEDRQQFLQ